MLSQHAYRNFVMQSYDCCRAIIPCEQCSLRIRLLLIVGEECRKLEVGTRSIRFYHCRSGGTRKHLVWKQIVLLRQVALLSDSHSPKSEQLYNRFTNSNVVDRRESGYNPNGCHPHPYYPDTSARSLAV